MKPSLESVVIESMVDGRYIGLSASRVDETIDTDSNKKKRELVIIPRYVYEEQGVKAVTRERCKHC